MFIGLNLLIRPIYKRYGRFWLFAVSKLLSLLSSMTLAIVCELGILPAIIIAILSVLQLKTKLSCLFSLLCTQNTRRIWSCVHVGNPAFGQRGTGIRRAARRKTRANPQYKFDSSLGYPGEGWSTLRFATWNSRGLTYERFKYCQSLNYDVLALSELWRKQHRFQTKRK